MPNEALAAANVVLFLALAWRMLAYMAQDAARKGSERARRGRKRQTRGRKEAEPC